MWGNLLEMAHRGLNWVLTVVQIKDLVTNGFMFIVYYSRAQMARYLHKNSVMIGLCYSECFLVLGSHILGHILP